MRSASLPAARCAATASSTSIPGGRAASRPTRQLVGIAVLGQPEFDVLGFTGGAGGSRSRPGDARDAAVKPDEYAIGTPARRMARSNARATSRWDVKRSRPRLA